MMDVIFDRLGGPVVMEQGLSGSSLDTRADIDAVLRPLAPDSQTPAVDQIASLAESREAH